MYVFGLIIQLRETLWGFLTRRIAPIHANLKLSGGGKRLETR